MENLDLHVSGLWTSPNQFNAPMGSLAIADNIVIDRSNVGQTRRGQKQYGTNIAGVAVVPGYFAKLYNYDNTLLGYDNGTLFYDSDNLGTWIAYTGTFNPVTGFALRGLEANRNFYINTDLGIYKLDSVTGAFKLSGSPQGLQGTFILTAGTIQPDNTNVAYRIVWGYTDANTNEIVGAPSQRLIVTNSSGSTQDVILTFQIPDGITTSYFYRIYRSRPSATAADSPDDEVQLVISGTPTGGEIAAGQIVKTDSQANLGAFLYTDPSQEGILQSNYEPPLAKDMALFNGYVFYATTIVKQFLNATLTALPTIGDTVTITHISGTQTYTAAATNNFALQQFKVETGGTLTENIRDTTQNLIQAINRNALNTVVYAYYSSGFDDIQGQFIIQNRLVSETAPTFTLTSSISFFFPTSITSSNEAKQNRIFISKFQQPEAVPILQFIVAGSENFPIRRIIALRDCVFVFKDDGVFQITGTDPTNFAVSVFDPTIKITAPEAAVALNNHVFLYTTQGICKVSLNQVTDELQDPLEQTFLQLQSGLYPNFQQLTFGVAYDSYQKYILYTVSTSDDTLSTQQFVYDFTTNSWTQWKTNRSCGIVSSRDGKLYTGTFDNSFTNIFVRQERKEYTRLDYADLEFTRTLTSVTGFVMLVNDTTDLEIGYTVKQDSKEALITDIPDLTHIVIDRDNLTWIPGNITIYQPIEVNIKLVPFTGQNVGYLKQVPECTYLFDDASFKKIEVGFKSNLGPRQTFNLFSNRRGNWGQFPWGSLPWGGGVGGRQGLRTFLPNETQWGLWIDFDMNLNQAFEFLGFMGISIVFEVQDTRIK